MADEQAPGGQEQQQQDTQPQEGGEQQAEETPAPKMYDEAYVKALRAEAAENRTKLKAQMSESERAIVEAEERGRTAVRTEYGRRLARERFDSLAARRNPDVKTSDVLEYVDLGRFVGEDGELDEKQLNAAVNRLVPEVATAAPAFDGGARATANPNQDMTAMIRKAAGRS